MREPTMADIAARLDVSRQLVSIALRGLAEASSETRERVRPGASIAGHYSLLMDSSDPRPQGPAGRAIPSAMRGGNLLPIGN